MPEEEEAGWGCRCPGAGYWHGYAGVARLGEDTHTGKHQAKPPTTCGTLPSDLLPLTPAQLTFPLSPSVPVPPNLSQL